MSRRELMALLAFVGAIAGWLYLSWLLFLRWPGDAAFVANYDSLASPVFNGFTGYILVVVALQNWWRRIEPLEDERDRAIDGAAAKRGFIALGLLNMVGGVALHARPELLSSHGAEWIRFCLLWMVLASMAVYSGYQVFRYRRG